MYYINNDIVTTDGYDFCKFMELDEFGTFDSLNSYWLYAIPLLPLQGTYKITLEENKPDLLSYNLYGDTQYWWIILWYNYLAKPTDLTVGLQINYPSLNSIQQLYTNTSLLEKTSSTE